MAISLVAWGLLTTVLGTVVRHQRAVAADELIKSTVRAVSAGDGAVGANAHARGAVRQILRLRGSSVPVVRVVAVDHRGHALASAPSADAAHRQAIARTLTVKDDARRESYRVSLAKPDAGASWRGIDLRLIIALVLAAVALIAKLTPPVRVRRNRRQPADRHHRDALTGLLNRAGFDESAAAALRGRRRCALLLLDLDRFKQVNDTLGHANGDSLLRQLGGRLRQVCREDDVMARLGGDEFAVLVDDAQSESDAVRVATRIAEAFDEPIVVGGLSLRVEASVGIALSPEHGRDLAALTHAADVAMYAAKRADQDYAIYSPDLDTADPESLALVGELRRAIAEDELCLHFQPKLDLTTGTVTGVEALARWHHPNRGLLTPGQFIPLAEQSNLLAAMTLHVAELAVKQAAHWRTRAVPITVAFNLSARNLLDAELPGQLYELTRSWRIPTHLVELEITESTIMSDPGRAHTILRTLDQMGFRLTIDDYGTGYSSLAYLQQLPVTTLKIDRSFVSDVPDNGANAEIVRSTVMMAQNLGLEVVAEGVETPAALGYLKHIGCDKVQGYLLSRPISASQLDTWLDAAEPALTDLAGVKPEDALLRAMTPPIGTEPTPA